MSRNLKSHNENQKIDLQRIRDEIKWLVGEKLHYDPDSTTEGRAQVELYFAGVIISGAGAWLAKKMEEKNLSDLDKN